MLPSIIVITKNTYRVVSLVDFNSGQSKDLSGNLRLITTKNETKIQRGLSRIDTFPRKGWANVSPRRSKVYSTLNFLAIHIRVQSRRFVLSPFMFRRVGKEASLTLLRFRFIADQLMCFGVIGFVLFGTSMVIWALCFGYLWVF